jgi:hypothetical protein
MNIEYMIAGYVVGLGILFLSAGSIWMRWRALEQDEAALARLAEEAKSNTPPATEPIKTPSAEPGQRGMADAT